MEENIKSDKPSKEKTEAVRRFFEEVEKRKKREEQESTKQPSTKK